MRGRQGFGKDEGAFRTAGGCLAVFRVAGRDLDNVLFTRPFFGGFKGVLVGVDRGGGQNFGHFRIHAILVLHLDRHLIMRCARYGVPCNEVAPVDGGSAAGFIAQNGVDVGNRGVCHIVLRVQHIGVIFAHRGIVDVLFAGDAIIALFVKGKHQLALRSVVFGYNSIGCGVNSAVSRVDISQIAGRIRHILRVAGGYLRGKVISGIDVFSGIQAVAVNLVIVFCRVVVSLPKVCIVVLTTIVTG